MNLRAVLATYQASCIEHTKGIKQFLDGRTGFGITYDEAITLDDMVGVLLDKVDGMDDAWDDILTLVGRHYMDTRETALFKKWSRIIKSTKKTINVALDISTRFHIVFPGDKDPGLDETNELFFSDEEPEDGASLNVNSVAEGADEVDAAESEATNEYESLDGDSTAEEDDEDTEAESEAAYEYTESDDVDDEDRHATEVAQSGTGLNNKVLDTALANRREINPGTCSYECPGKTPDPVIAPERLVRSQCLALNKSRRSSYLEIDRIREFLDYHESTKVTRKELEELGNLERALD
jgi:hypothetical protein